MLAALAVSAAFLVSYVVHHALHGSTAFQGRGVVRTFYFVVLVSHVVLAAFVPFLAVATAWLGLRDRRPAHRRLARWTYPIWLYVSVTGVVVYLMLYPLGTVFAGP